MKACSFLIYVLGAEVTRSAINRTDYLAKAGPAKASLGLKGRQCKFDIFADKYGRFLAERVSLQERLLEEVMCNPVPSDD